GTGWGAGGGFDAPAALWVMNFRTVAGQLRLPDLANHRLAITAVGNWLDAPAMPFYGVGNDSSDNRRDYAYRTTTVGATARLQAAPSVGVGGGMDLFAITSSDISPTYRRSRLFAEYDWRTSPAYTRKGGLYRVDWSDYHDTTNGGRNSFRRLDAEVDQFVPLLRENWVIALRAAMSTTDTNDG